MAKLINKIAALRKSDSDSSCEEKDNEDMTTIIAEKQAGSRTVSPTSDVGSEASDGSQLLDGGSVRLNSKAEGLNLPADIDFALVEQLREELRRECELRPEDGTGSRVDEQYASKHYDQLMDPESPFTCWRYLVHCNYQLGDTLDLIKSAIKWRKENGADEPLDGELAKEFWFHAPIMFCGKTRNEQHDIVYVIGKHYRKPDSALGPIIRKYCQNLLFSWDRMHEHDLQQFCFVFDVSDTGYRNIDLEFMSWLVSVRDYLPARIAQIHVIGIPFLVRPLIKLIISWLPEKFSKIVRCGSWDQLIEDYMDLDQLPQEVGGQLEEVNYRLAPIEAPWSQETSIFSEPNMIKSIDESIWFHVTDEQRDRLRANQLTFESRLAAVPTPASADQVNGYQEVDLDRRAE